MGRGRLGRGDDIRLAGAEAAERDVVADRIVEQRHVLADDGDGAAQAVERDIAHVLAVNGDAASIHVIQTRNEIDDRRLAGPRTAYEGGCRAPGHRERQVTDSLQVRGIGVAKLTASKAMVLLVVLSAVAPGFSVTLGCSSRSS